MQQQTPSATMKTLVGQVSGLRKLNQIGAIYKYSFVVDGKHKLTIPVFSGVGLAYDRAWLLSIAVIFIDYIETDALFHIQTWLSYRSKHPVSSSEAAGTMVTGEVIDDAKHLTKLLSFTYIICVPI